MGISGTLNSDGPKIQWEIYRRIWNMSDFANIARSLSMPGWISRVMPAAMQDSE